MQIVGMCDRKVVVSFSRLQQLTTKCHQLAPLAKVDVAILGPQYQMTNDAAALG
jgi:hypothetical protein